MLDGPEPADTLPPFFESHATSVSTWEDRRPALESSPTR